MAVWLLDDALLVCVDVCFVLLRMFVERCYLSLVSVVCVCVCLFDCSGISLKWILGQYSNVFWMNIGNNW